MAGRLKNQGPKKIQIVEKRIRRLKRLKDGGIEAYGEHPEIQELLRFWFQACARCGLFLVPVGELEDWGPRPDAGVS